MATYLKIISIFLTTEPGIRQIKSNSLNLLGQILTYEHDKIVPDALSTMKTRRLTSSKETVGSKLGTDEHHFSSIYSPIRGVVHCMKSFPSNFLSPKKLFRVCRRLQDRRHGAWQIEDRAKHQALDAGNLIYL